jgi:hypothetical protein
VNARAVSVPEDQKKIARGNPGFFVEGDPTADLGHDRAGETSLDDKANINRPGAAKHKSHDY